MHLPLNRLFSFAPTLFALLMLAGCTHSRHTYAPTDEFFASGRFPVPREFRHGTAGRAQVDAWSTSLLGDTPLNFMRIDIDHDGAGELFISQPRTGGNGGNAHLVFKEHRRGFRYLGKLSFGAIRPIAPDAGGNERVLTTGWMGACECLVTIEVLKSDGFHKAASRVLPCGDCAEDDAKGRLFRTLMEQESPPADVLRSVFGAEF